MTIWGIADLHLSFGTPDRPGKFGALRKDHWVRVESEWLEVVRPEDLVLMPGDLSSARNHRELQADLAWLDRLPGLKVISRGNHDRWWNGVDRVRPLLRKSQRAVGGDAVRERGVIICGTLGAPVLPEGNAPDAEKEFAALDRSIAAALSLRQADEPIVALWHYPPFDARKRPSPIVERLEAAGVSICLYGHLHSRSSWGVAPQGKIGAVRYFCVASDSIGFRPLRVAVIE